MLQVEGFHIALSRRTITYWLIRRNFVRHHWIPCTMEQPGLIHRQTAPSKSLMGNHTLGRSYFLQVKVRVKCTIVQELRLCKGRTAHTGSRSIALLFHDRGTRGVWVVSSTPRPIFTPGKDPVPIVQETGWALGAVWTGAENLAAPRFDPRTVQPVVSRYTDCVTRLTLASKFV